MSIFCENEGKLVTIVIPNRIAIGSQVKVIKCHKKLRDRDCRGCLAKHACAVFLDEPRFSLKTFCGGRRRRKRKP
ncbi:MAG: hypothetical protein ABSF24_06705 [Candidatus Bathyarchaeia archaeon]